MNPLKRRALSFICLLACTLVTAPVLAEQAAGLRPYTARYAVSYRGLEGGDIEFTLERLDNGHYRFRSQLFPSFLGSLFASDQAEDSSEFTLNDGRIQPLHFRSEDGTQNSKKDIRIDFDWGRGMASGRVGERDFELQVPPGAQERMSIQLAASLALQAGHEPGKLVMMEKDQVQEYTIKRTGSENVRMPAGEYEATVLTSQRTGSTRATRYWYAQQLNYLPVQAERTTKGKVDIVMQLKSFAFND